MRLRNLGLLVVAGALGANCSNPPDAPPAVPSSLPPPAPHPATGTLSVTALGPQGVISEVTQAFATFDKPVATPGVQDSTLAASLLRITPAPRGQYRFVGAHTVVFDFSGAPARSTVFTLEVPTTARALDGSGPARSSVATFSTPGLRLLRTQPAAGFRLAETSPVFRFWFDQPVAPGALQRHLALKVLEPKDAPATVSNVACTLLNEAKDATPVGERSYGLRCQAQGSFPPGARMQLTLAGELTGTQGPRTLGQGVTLPFWVHGLPGLKEVRCPHGCQPEPGATLEFLTPISAADNRSFLTLDPPPATPWQLAQHRSTTLQTGPLMPVTRYTLTVRPGLTDAFGQKLVTGRTEHFTTGAAQPWALVPQGLVVRHPTQPNLPLRTVHVASAQVMLWRISEPDAVAVAQNLGQQGRDPVRKPDVTLSVHPTATVDSVPALTSIDLTSALPKGHGLVAYTVSVPEVVNPGGHGLVARGLVQVTNLGVHLKTWRTGSWVWVTRLSNGTPVPGARVKLFVRGKLSWTGSTNAEGMAQAPLGQSNTQPIWAVVGADNDVALVSSDDAPGMSDDDLGVAAEDPTQGSGDLGLLRTDRDVYSPGNQVHVKGVVRVWTGDSLAVPGGLVRGVLREPQGHLSVVRELRLSSLGTVSFTWALPANAAPGTWGVELARKGSVAAYASFSVVRPAAEALAVKVVPATLDAVAGDVVDVHVAIHDSRGAPIWGATLGPLVTWTPVVSAAAGDSGADAGRNASVPSQQARILEQGKALSDANGSCTLHVALPHLDPADRAQLMVEVHASHPDLGSGTGSASVAVQPAGHQLALTVPGRLVATDSPFTVEVATLGDPGTDALHAEVTLLRRQGLTNGAAAGGSNAVGACSLHHVGQTPQPCAFTADRPGAYVVHVTSADTKRRVTSTSAAVWVHGPGAAPWETAASARMVLTADQELYQPGQVARVMVHNPLPGGVALVTLERSSILWHKIMAFEGSAPVVDIPIAAHHAPNVYVRAHVVGTNHAGAPLFATGVVQLNVAANQNRLTVTLAPNGPTYAPGQSAQVRVSLADSNGAPVAGEVTLMAVDDAVTSRNAAADPLELFFAPRGLAVHSADARAYLVETQQAVTEEQEADGPPPLPAEPPTAAKAPAPTCFLPAVRIPASGHARATVPIPDAAGVRLMALGISSGNRFGTAEHRLAIGRPLGVSISAPPMLHRGDQAQLAVALTHGLADAVDVAVQVENLTPQVAALSDAPALVGVPAGAAAVFNLQVRALRGGLLRLRLAAGAGRHQEHVNVEIPVRTIALPRAHGHSGTVSRGSPVDIPLSVPLDAQPGSGMATVVLGNTPLGALVGPLEQLRTPLHDCTESAAGALLAAVELAGIPALVPSGRAADVQLHVTRLLSFQQPDGGFAFWSNGSTQMWTTAHAALALRWAQRAGHAVPPQALRSASAYLMQRMGGTARQGFDEDTAAFAADVLVQLRNNVADVLQALFDRRARMTADGRAHLLHALATLRRKALTTTLAQELMDESAAGDGGRIPSADEEHRNVRTSSMRSPTRTMALLLRAYVAAALPLARMRPLASVLLKRQVSGMYRNRQEAAWVLMAFKDLQNAALEPRADVGVTALVGGQLLLNRSFRGNTAAAAAATHPVGSGSALPLQMTAAGAGTVHWAAWVTHVPGSPPEQQATDRGLFIERTLHSPQGPAVLSAAAGQRLRLQTEAATAWDRRHVVVTVPVPAGVELVNPQPQGCFDHVERAEGRLLLFAQAMPAGVHRFTVDAHSITPGVFTWPPAHLEEMYAPEISGQTAGGTFTVTAAGAHHDRSTAH